MEGLMLQNDLAVHLVPLGKHEQILERPLPQEIIRVRDQIQKNLQRRFKADLVIIVNHEGGFSPRIGLGTLSIENPLKTSSVERLELVFDRIAVVEIVRSFLFPVVGNYRLLGVHMFRFLTCLVSL